MDVARQARSHKISTSTVAISNISLNIDELKLILELNINKSISENLGKYIILTHIVKSKSPVFTIFITIGRCKVQ